MQKWNVIEKTGRVFKEKIYIKGAIMDYSLVLEYVTDIVKYCIPFTLIFGFTAKMLNFAFDMIFNKKIEL